MNIYLHEVKMNMQSVLVWSLSIAALIFVFLGLFSSIAVDLEAFNSILQNYPPEMLAAFGWDKMDVSNPLGFFAFAFLFAQICVSIQASNYGFSLVSVEERELTADFLLAKPVGRWTILTIKLLAALTSLAITNAVVWVSSIVALAAFTDNGYDTHTFVLVMLTITFLQLFFLMVGLVISLMMRRVRSVIPLTMGMVFGMFLLGSFGGALGGDAFDYVTPFKHFEATAIIQDGSYDLSKVAVSVTVTVVSLIASYVLYKQRNIPTV